MKRFTAFVLAALLGAGLAQAQKKNDEQAVGEVIQKLFKAMELGDSVMARNCFAGEVTSATVFKDKSGNTKIERDTSVDDFIKAIGSPHGQTWYEEIWNLQIRVDQDFAQAWCDYAFYLGKNFSHCGVDALQLYRINGEWKIFHLADTRRKSGCEIPAEILKKHE